MILGQVYEPKMEFYHCVNFQSIFLQQSSSFFSTFQLMLKSNFSWKDIYCYLHSEIPLSPTSRQCCNLLLLDLMKCVLLPPLLLFGLWPVESKALGHLMRATECIISHKSHKSMTKATGSNVAPWLQHHRAKQSFLIAQKMSFSRASAPASLMKLQCFIASYYLSHIFIASQFSKFLFGNH